MATAVILCSVCVSAFMIWCSLQTNLTYVVISERLLHKWEIERENLIVIDIRPRAPKWAHGSIPDSLQASEHELASLLRWIPPKSTVVFCPGTHVGRFDREIEEALFRAAIDSVYLLDLREQFDPVESRSKSMR
jgi:rhodanese-related sulfurtransferase